jgi:hypothetical protein
MTGNTVTPKRYYTFMIDPELADALRAAKDESPELSEASIIRQALRDWFKKHGVKVKRAARTRKRAERP